MTFSDSASERRRETALVLRSPEDVLDGLNNNSTIRDWLDFIESKYVMPRREVLLLFPCTATKPYLESRSYRILLETLNQINGSKGKIHLATVSEPFGLVPQEFYDDTQWNYDCPGLFQWWCERNSIDYDPDTVRQCLEIIGKAVGRFLERNYLRRFATLIACVRYCSSSLAFKGDHTHRRILEIASDVSGVPIRFVPNRAQIRSLVTSRGAFAWDMYGPAHPVAQCHLRSSLEVALGDRS